MDSYFVAVHRIDISIGHLYYPYKVAPQQSLFPFIQTGQKYNNNLKIKKLLKKTASLLST